MTDGRGGASGSLFDKGTEIGRVAVAEKLCNFCNGHIGGREKVYGDVALIPQLANKTMLGRIGQSYERAGAVLLLTSDASTFMTGTNIVVDGGWTAW